MSGDGDSRSSPGWSALDAASETPGKTTIKSRRGMCVTTTPHNQHNPNNGDGDKHASTRHSWDWVGGREWRNMHVGENRTCRMQRRTIKHLTDGRVEQPPPLLFRAGVVPALPLQHAGAAAVGGEKGRTPKTKKGRDHRSPATVAAEKGNEDRSKARNKQTEKRHLYSFSRDLEAKKPSSA